MNYGNDSTASIIPQLVGVLAFKTIMLWHILVVTRDFLCIDSLCMHFQYELYSYKDLSSRAFNSISFAQSRTVTIAARVIPSTYLRRSNNYRSSISLPS
jgi:hypothetical protein